MSNDHNTTGLTVLAHVAWTLGLSQDGGASEIHERIVSHIQATQERVRAEVYRQVIAWCDAPPLDDADAGATVAEAAARDALRDARREAAQAGYSEGQKAARAEVLAEIEALLSQSRAAVAQGEEERGRLVAQCDALARAIDDETRRAVTLHRLAAHLRGTP
jgi:hypothetical protein